MQVAFQDALGNAKNDMQMKAAEQEEHLERAKAANLTELEMARAGIAERNSQIEKLQKELSFLSNSKKLHEMYKAAKKEAEQRASELAESAEEIRTMTEAEAESTAAHSKAMQALKALKATADQDNTTLQTQVSKLREDLQERVSENEVARADMGKLREHSNELEKKVDVMATEKEEFAKQAKEELEKTKANAEAEAKQLMEKMEAKDQKATAEMAAAQQQWQTEHEALASERAQVESALQERVKAVQQLEAQLQEQQEASAAKLASQASAHSEALKTAEGERDKVAQEHAQTLKEREELEQFKDKATVAAALSAKELDRLQTDLSTHQEQLKGANADLASHREKLVKTEAATAELQKAKAELESNLEKMTQVANEHDAARAANATEIGEVTQKLADAVSNTQKLENELQAAAAAATALQAEKEALAASGASSSERVASLEAAMKQQEADRVSAVNGLEQRHAAQVERHEAVLAEAHQQHSTALAALNTATEEQISGLKAEWTQKLSTAAGDSATALAALQQEMQAQQQTHQDAIQKAESSHATAVGALTQQVTELKAGVDERDAAARAQTAQITELDGLLQTSKAEWEAHKAELTEAAQARSKELEEKNSALSSMEQDLSEHRLQLEARTAELESQKASLADGNAQAGELRVQLQSAETALSEHKALLEKEKAALASETQKAEKLQTDLDAQLARAKELTAEMTAAANEHAEEVGNLQGILEAQIEEGKASEAKATSTLEKTKAAHATEVQSVQQQLEAEKAAHNTAIQELKAKIGELSGSYNAVRGELESAKLQLKTSGADAANMSAQMATLQKGTEIAKKMGEQEREAAELQQKKLALTVKARKVQLDAARMSLLLIQAAGLFDKSTDNETQHFEVVENCARSNQMVSVLLGVQCEGSLKDWHVDEARNLENFVSKVLEDVKVKKEGLEAANAEVTKRAEELTKMSEALSKATHELEDAYQEQLGIQASMHKAELADNDSASALREQHEKKLASLGPIEKEQAKMLNELLSASDKDKVHAIVARRDFTGKEWTDQLQVRR